METNKEPQGAKKAYQVPELIIIELKSEQVLAIGCNDIVDCLDHQGQTGCS